MSSATDLSQALEDCLNRLRAGEATLDDCLARYPEHAAELGRLLRTQAVLSAAGGTAAPTAQARAAGRAQLLAHMRANPRRGKKRASGAAWAGNLRLAFGLGLVAALLLSGGTAFAQLAAPGDALYGWKRASEAVWRAVQPDPLAADLALAGRRADELVLVAGDPANEAIALIGYQQSLEAVAANTGPESANVIHEALGGQREALAEAGLSVPELDSLLASLPQPLPPAPTPTGAVTASGLELEVTLPSPAIELTLAPPGALPGVENTASGEASPTPTQTPTATPTHTAPPEESPTPLIELPTLPVTLPVGTALPGIVP